MSSSGAAPGNLLLFIASLARPLLVGRGALLAARLLLSGCSWVSDLTGGSDKRGEVSCYDIHLEVPPISGAKNAFEIKLVDRAGDTIKEAWDITTCYRATGECERRGFVRTIGFDGHKAGVSQVMAASGGCEAGADVTVQ